MLFKKFQTHRIHGTNGIFILIKTIKINQSCGEIYNRLMDPMLGCPRKIVNG